MSEFNFDLFKQICETRATSGEERDLVVLLRELYLKNDVEIIYDNLGCMVAHKPCKKENALKVLVLAHADEIGYLVTGVNGDGTIKVSPIGGISPFVGDRVVLKNSDNKLFDGIIINRTFNNDKVESLEFDFGFDSKKEVEENNIGIGNIVYFKGDTVKINDKRVVSKAIDDRYGCCLTVDLLNAINKDELDIDLYIGVSVQEEVGCRGAQTITNKINPDLAIVLDCSPSDSKNNNGFLGKGVLLRVKDANMLAFKSLINYQKEVCESLNVPYQYFISMGGTDAGNIHKSYDGVLTLTHCICAKNLHSSSTMMDINDYIAAKKSLIYIIKDLNKDKFNKFVEENR